jgi:predicted dinucleotide-binding enzyme
VNIGIIGSGNMGAGMGKIWAAKGHKVLFSFSKDQEKLRAVAAAAGPNARAGTPAGAVAFGELILLSVPCAAVPEALKAAGNFEGKTLFSCVNCLKPDFSGLEVGTSAAGEIVKLAPGAKIVEAIPPMAQILAADSRRLDGQQTSAFYCGNDPAARASVASLLRDLDLNPVDAGPLTMPGTSSLPGCSAFSWPMAWAWERSWRRSC